MAENDNLLEFDFAEVDEKEFEVHLQNKGVEQRGNVTGQDQLRKKGVVLCGRLVEAVHGHVKEGGDACTLVVFEWYAHTREPGRRIKFARIDINFTSSKGSLKYDPWVKDCAPWGSYSLFESDKTVEKTKSWNPSVKFGQDGIATGEIPFLYELKETIDRVEQIYVDGCPLPPEDNAYYHPDRFTAVEWNLFENEGQRSGIPRYFRTAVLLDRTEGGQGRFKAKVSINVRVSLLDDTRECIKAFLGLRTKDEPIIFNPALKPKTDRFDTKINTLGSVSLEPEIGFLLFKNKPGDKAKAKEVKEKEAEEEKENAAADK